jgi:hypothetical protein
MKNNEKTPSTVGIFRLSNYKSDSSDKVMRIFTKLKKRAKQVQPKIEAAPQSPEPNLRELSESAMNSYRIGPEVIKTNHGFEVV